MGVDLGQQSIKIVQLEFAGGVGRLVSSKWIDLHHEQERVDRPGLIVADAIAGGRFKAAGIACALPKICYSEEVLDSTDDFDPADPTTSIWSHLQRRSPIQPSESTLDYWPLPSPDETTAPRRWQVIAVRNRIVNDLVRDCQSMDSRVSCVDTIPFVAMRCAQLHCGGIEEQPVGVLDWGLSSARLTLIQRGLPIYSRELRRSSWTDAIRLISDGLGISSGDATNLVGRLNRDQRPDSAFAQRMQHEMNQLLQPLRAELEREFDRTMSYAKAKLRIRHLTKLIVTGGGASHWQLIRDIADDSVAEVAPFRIAGWKDERFPESMHPGFAHAISLSVLGFDGVDQ